MLIASNVRSIFEVGANQLGRSASEDEMAHRFEAMAGIKFVAAKVSGFSRGRKERCPERCRQL